MSDYFQLLNLISRQKVPPVLFCHVEDHYLMRELLSLLEKTVLNGPVDFNYDRINAKQMSVSSWLALVQTPPMMSTHRLVCIDQIDKIKKEDVDDLLAYLQKPISDTVLVLLCQQSGILRKCESLCKTQQFYFDIAPLKKPALFKYVQEMAQKLYQIKLAPSCSDVLFDAYSTDAAQWMMAVERVYLYAPKESFVDDRLLERVTQKTSMDSVFKLTDAFLDKRANILLPVTQTLLLQKEEPLAMAGLCTRSVRSLMNIKVSLEQGEDQKTLAQKAGVPEFLLPRYLKVAKETSWRTLFLVHRTLLKSDISLKSSGVSKELQYFFAMWKCCIEQT